MEKISDCERFVKIIEGYIAYYHSVQLQGNPEILTPMEKHSIVRLRKKRPVPYGTDREKRMQ